ncbi:MAG TPA: LuxR C-terminal-related transcriptional regulator [Gaiellaceae bacterium]|jgi:PAS domain S-box-containing protein|nr:LuxR C-terminal-related transcriptional regulator [Gaiellaceae bacterium]
MAAYDSGDALMAADGDKRVRVWNAAAERMLGLAAADVVGLPCWEVLAASGEDGSVVCHPGCSRARLSAAGHPVASQRMRVRTGHNGKKLVDVATLSVADGDDVACLHVLRDAEAPARPRDAGLTSREREVLSLLAEGMPVKTIARQLRIAEVTVRNHVRGILTELGVRSQLAAVAEARRRRLI